MDERRPHETRDPCVSCGEFARTICGRCDPDEFQIRCAECHAEVTHGEIAGAPARAADGGYRWQEGHGQPTRDPSPWTENNIRILEDG